MPLMYAAADWHLHGTARRMARVFRRVGACPGDPSRGGGTAADLGSQGRWACSTQTARRRGGRVGPDVPGGGVPREPSLAVLQFGLCSCWVAMVPPCRCSLRRAMADSDPLPTQRDISAGIPAELVAAGFEEPEEIGRGGFGVVYRCSQRALDRTVAVKVLTADLEPDNLERFVREQVAMGKLSGHPHIVNIFQVGTTATGRPYIVMQYHPNGSLEAKIHDT